MEERKFFIETYGCQMNVADSEVITLQNKTSPENNRASIGKTFEALLEGLSKKSNEMLAGRTSQNKVAVFRKYQFKKGGLVKVTISCCTQTTLTGYISK